MGLPGGRCRPGAVGGAESTKQTLPTDGFVQFVITPGLSAIQSKPLIQKAFLLDPLTLLFVSRPC